MTSADQSHRCGRSNGHLHVLFVAGCWYPHEEQPFQGIFIRRHAEVVAARHRVTVLHPIALENGPRRPTVSLFERGSIRELHIRFRKPANRFLGAWRHQPGFFRAGKIGCSEIRSSNPFPDIIHFHVIPSAGLTSAIVSAFPGLPIIVTEHWSGYLPESGVRLSLPRKVYTRWLLRKARVVTTVSNRHRDAMLDLGFNGRYVVVPNVVDINVFQPGARERTNRGIRFVHVSGLRREKNVPGIIMATGELLKRFPYSELHIVGDGPERGAAEIAARNQGPAAQRIFFHGMLESDGVAAVLRRCDVFVLFSDFENSPCVIPEALACGLFVVAPKVGGIPELINTDRGILIPPRDQTALSAALEDLAVRGRFWDAEALRTYVIETFSPNIVRRQFEDVYVMATER